MRSLLRKTDDETRKRFLELIDGAIAKAEKEADAEARRRQRDPRLASIDADKELCKSLYEFVKLGWVILEPHAIFVDNWHIQAICEHLEAVTHGKINRLLINVPPGSMKSLLVSVFWPAWEWAMGHTSYRYITTSFAEDACDRDTRRMRDLVTSEWYQARWPAVQLVRRGDSAISNTGTGWRESSAFGSLTNKRGDRLIIDDPHSVKTAESDVQRAETVRSFREGAINRLNDQRLSAIVIIMQRLHEHDVAGTALALRLGYCHLMIPMEFEIKRRCITSIGWKDPRTEEGELMDPGRFPREELDKLRGGMGAHAFAGQYQQRPTAREGGLFKRHWFHVVKTIPVGMGEPVRSVRRWDLAATKEKAGTDPDWTVGLRMDAVGHGEHRRFYISGVVRFRDDPNAVRTAIKATGLADGKKVKIRIPKDPGQAGVYQAQNIIAGMAGFDIRADRETGDKALRAEPFAAQLEAGNVFLVEGAWNEEFIEELCAFPRGHDDQVDAASGAMMELEQEHVGYGLTLSAMANSRENPFSVR